MTWLEVPIKVADGSGLSVGTMINLTTVAMVTRTKIIGEIQLTFVNGMAVIAQKTYADMLDFLIPIDKSNE